MKNEWTCCVFDSVWYEKYGYYWNEKEGGVCEGNEEQVNDLEHRLWNGATCGVTWVLCVQLREFRCRGNQNGLKNEGVWLRLKKTNYGHAITT